MEDGRGALMEVEHSLGNFNRQSPPLLPGDVVVLILEVGPQGSSLAVLQYQAVVRVGGYCLDK